MTDRPGDDSRPDGSIEPPIQAVEPAIEPPIEPPDAADDGEREPADRRRARLVALAVVVALGVLGATWTLASPVGSSPDDDYHLASIWCSSSAPDDECLDFGWSYSPRLTFVEVPAEVGPMWCYAGRSTTSAACVDEIEPGTVARTVADNGLYPGLYYWAMGFVVGSEPVDSALLARLASWTACLLLLAAGWAVLPQRHRLAYLLALAVTAVPHAVFLWASTNPSGVVVAAVAAAWCATVALLQADEHTGEQGDGHIDEHDRRRAALVAVTLLVVATIAAAGSRADGGLYEFIAVVSACALCWRPGRAQLSRFAAVGAIGAIGLLTSAVVLSRRLATTGVGGLTSPQLESPPAGSVWNNVLEVPYFLAGNLGTAGLGWLDTPMPRLVWASMLIAFSAVVFRGLANTDRAKGVALLVLLGGLLVVPSYFLWRAGTTVGFEVQPRYVLPLLPVLAATALFWRRGRSTAGFSGAQLVTVLVLVVLAHSAALHANIRRYVTGIDVASPDLDAGREWWWDIPLSPNAVWVLGSVAFAGLATGLGLAIRGAETAPESGPATADSYA